MPEIKRIVNNLLATNTYIYFLDEKKCLIIDPGSDYKNIKDFIDESGLQPEAILATHGHFDHVASAAQLQKDFNCKLYLHKKDLKTLKLSNFMMKMFSLKGSIEIPKPDITFDDSAEFEILNKKVFFFHTPGHTYGSCVIKIDDNLFTGDTLFYSKVSSKIPNESAKMLTESQKLVFERFSENLLALPGHGDSGLLKDVKKAMPLSINN
ncbi:MAG: MBL fold metallo-hydrolase [Bacteroidetes bacterium]|nr:MBL fold metallo-hydrolase [Bacteroidota bacterium]